MRFRIVRREPLVAAAAVIAVAVASAGCGTDIKGDHANLVHGKQLFVQKCGACHTLARAATKGTLGPNLDDAFAQSLREGFKTNAVRGVVEQQVLYPNASGKMPPKIYTGQDASDVAAYVAYAAAKPGQDGEPLKSAVKSATQGSAAASNGKLAIPTDPNGQLAYTVTKATAPAGPLEIDSVNKSGTPHDIAIQSGANGPTIATGAVVTGGGTSKVTVNLKPGTYTFYCTVPTHRAGGMLGTLVVK